MTENLDQTVAYQAAARRLDRAQRDFDQAEREFAVAQLRKVHAAEQLEAAFTAFHIAAEQEYGEIDTYILENGISNTQGGE